MKKQRLPPVWNSYMKQWHKAYLFLGFLERKKQIIINHISEIERELIQLEKDIQSRQQKIQMIIAQIEGLTPSGRLEPLEISHKFRQQAILLNQQQLLIQHLSVLEEKKLLQLERLNACYQQMNLLDKKHYKLSFFLKKQRHTYLMKKNLNIENEIGELLRYGSQHTFISKK